MNLEQLGKRAEFWCKVLGVEDNWKVNLEVGNTGNMDGYAGLNFIDGEHQSSKIMIALGEDEETLVHEVLHIILDGHKSEEEREYSVMHERAINKIAKALVEINSKKKLNVKNKTSRAISQNIKSTRGKKNSKTRNFKVATRTR